MNRPLPWRWIVALALLLALLPAAAPRPARAQTQDEEIVYIDPAGVIRVRDPQPVGSRPPVTWFSPTGGYTSTAMIDVNADGDLEIAALRNFSGSYRLDLYDPVVASGPIEPGQSIGGIPWLLLFSLELEDQPALIAAGNLDPAYPGEEIFVTERELRTVNGVEAWRQDLFYLRNVGDADGRSWQRVDLPITGEDWTSVALGDLDRDQVAEVALVARAVSDLHIWKMTGGGAATRIYDNESEDRPWQHIAMGSFRGDGRDMLAAVRDAPRVEASLVVLRISGSGPGITTDYAENFEPSPTFVFYGDVNGSGDEEVFMMRSLPVTNTVGARLFMRNRPNGETTTAFETPLDADNGFRVGAAGDLDSDGRDEVVVLRTNRLRTFQAPESSTTFTEETISSDGRTLVIGDLDGASFIQELSLVPSVTAIDCTAPSGAAAAPVTLQVTNGVNSTPIQFALAIDGRPPWVSAGSSSTTTPATLTITCDASQLTSGVYTTGLLLTSPNPLVLNQPVRVEIRFVVGNGLLVRPPSLAFVQYPCAEPFAVQSQTVEVVAPAGTAYTVSLVQAPTATEAAAGAATGAVSPAAPAVTWPSSVPWAEAFSPTGVAPESLTITVDFGDRTADYEAARAVIIATVDGASQVRTLPITLLCAASQVPLPAVSR